MAKKIENKIAVLNPEYSQTYGELIMVCVQAQTLVQGQPQGFDYETLKKIQRVDSVVGKDKIVKDYSFEDSDFEFIKDKVSVMKWNVYSPELLAFISYIVELK